MRSTRKFEIAVLSMALSASICPTAFAARIVSISICEKIVNPGIVPQGITDQFPFDAPAVNAVLVLDKVKAGMRVKGCWISVDAVATPEYQIDSSMVRLKQNETRVSFSLTRPANGWPEGNYRLEIYFDDNFVTSTPFKISSKNSGGGLAERKDSRPKNGNKPDAADNLIGNWICQTSYGSSVLVFKSDKQLVLDGGTFDYTVAGNVLKISDDTGETDHAFVLDGDNLSIEIDRDFSMTYRRANDRIAPSDLVEDVDEEVEQDEEPPGGAADANLMIHFAGTWWNATTNTETNVVLAADGRYYETSSSSYSGGSSDQYGNPDMNWGSAQDSDARGTWTVNGDTRQGEITITYQDGGRRIVTYRVHVENGHVYWTEYYFNGVLYGKK